MRVPRVLLIAITALLIVDGLAVLSAPAGPPPLASPKDTDLFRAVVERVRDGEPYYRADVEEMRPRGYPTSSVFNWRLPTLTLIQAALPSIQWSVAILTALGLGAIALWVRFLAGVPLRWKPLAWPFLLMTVPAWAWVNPPSAFLHDLWAGQLIALSLACWACGFRRASLTAGLAAVLIREFAAPYILVMVAMSAFEKDRREATAWATVFLGFLAFLIWHTGNALPMTAPDVIRAGWLQFGGWRFVLSTARVNVLLILAPAWVAAVVVPLAWAGLFSWTGGVGRRAAVTVTIYLAAFTVIGRPDNSYWGLLIAPLLPLGVFGWLPSRQLPAVARERSRPVTAEST